MQHSAATEHLRLPPQNPWRLHVPLSQFVKELYREINDDNVFNGAAVLGFYLTLAIFPAAIFVMAVLPYLPVAHVDQAIMDLLQQALPKEAAQMFTGVVQEVTGERRGGLLSFGLLAALWAASSGMYAIMQELNVTYDVNESRGFVKTRAMAIGLSLLFTALAVGGFTLIVMGGTLQSWLADRFSFGSVVLAVFAVLRWVIIVAGLLLSYALIYYLAPSVKQRFVFITPGSAIGVTVLVIASLVFSWYVQHFGNYSATYGSIGAVIILMLWLYLAGLTILFGSEVNALIEHHSDTGKQKGEHVEGEARRSDTARERVKNVAPEKTSKKR